MTLDSLRTLIKSNRWSELEHAWLGAIEQPGTDRKQLLSILDATSKSNQAHLADSMGWAWLSSMKETTTPGTALELGRELLLKLTDGDELREEILGLYRQTHADRADLEEWIDRSGLKGGEGGKSVRRALRFLDTGLSLAVGAFLMHRTEDQAAEVMELDVASGSVTLRLPRGRGGIGPAGGAGTADGPGATREMDIEALASDYDVAEASDFRVMQQLHPQRIAELARTDPAALVIGVLRGHGNKMSRDNLKLLLSPRYVRAEAWSDWWTKLRNETKKSPNLRIEGRSPMFLIHDPAGQSPEEEAWRSFGRAQSPRDWLEALEGYLRLTKEQKVEPNPTLLNRVQAALVGSIDRFKKHKEPAKAFATALVIERVAMDGLPVSTDAHGMALEMLRKAGDPVLMVRCVPDARLWSLGTTCLEQAFPSDWPAHFAELILHAPAGQCDVLAKRVEKAGRGELLPGIVDRALAEPGRYTDAMMWLWKGPEVEVELPIPPTVEILGLVLSLVGPARVSEGKAAGQSVNDMRAKVRSGLSARDYARYRQFIAATDDDFMAQALRRQIERAEGLGPTVQDEMSNILRARFPNMYTKPKLALWEDEGTLYFTGPGLKTKEAELQDVVNVKMRENAKAIGEAASHGDLSENSEYKFALEERDLLRARVAKLNRELSIAKLLEPGEIPVDHVSIGQRVTLRPTGGGEELVMTILGFDEADITGRVYSYKSPIAMQLMGKKPGDVVKLAGGEEEMVGTEYEIERIERAMEQQGAG